MRNRNHTIPVAAVGLIVLCSVPAQAKDGSAVAGDHICPLPSNIRSRVDHCNQVGDFGAPEGRPGYMGGGKSVPGYPMGGARANPVLPKVPLGSPIQSPGDNLYAPGKKFNKSPDKQTVTPSKDQMLESKSDSEPAKKEPEKTPSKEPPKEK